MSNSIGIYVVINMSPLNHFEQIHIAIDNQQTVSFTPISRCYQWNGCVDFNKQQIITQN